MIKKIKENANKIVGIITILSGLLFLFMSYISFKADSKSLDGWSFACLGIATLCLGVTSLTNKMSELSKLLLALSFGIIISIVITVLINGISRFVYHDWEHGLNLKDFLLSLSLPISSTMIGFFLGNGESNDKLDKINDKLDKINDKLDKLDKMD